MEKEQVQLGAMERPSISRDCLKRAVGKLVSQYDNKDRSNEVLPEAVYLKQLPNYEEFFSNFLLQNQLCILSEEATRSWRSRKEWVQQDGRPNIDFFLQAFGEATVPVANCDKKEFSAHMKQEMQMRDFLAHWKKSQDAECSSSVHTDCLYLKDWHFTRAFPDYRAYSTTGYFRSDWMNEFWDVREDIDDDYRFVYMGPKGSWTPFHADVFRSFSWSANICGRKKWIFYPPGEEEFLKDVHGNLAYDVTSDELSDVRKFPNAHKAKHRIELIQNPGETVFVPSGWHHQVHNLDDTISINHNWLNGCNVRHCWMHLKDSLKEVEREISDCCDMDGWEQQCQLILKACTGIDFVEFFRFMETVAGRRQDALEQWRRSSVDSIGLVRECSISNSATLTADAATVQENKGRDQNMEDRAESASASLGLFNGEQGSIQTCSGSAVCQERRPDISADLVECHCEEQNGDSTQGGERNNNLSNMGLCQLESKRRAKLDDDSSAKLSSETAERQDRVGSSLCKYPQRADACPETTSMNTDDLLNLFQSLVVSRDMKEPHWARCSVNHALFDLVSVALVVQDMVKTADIESLLPAKQTKTPKALLQSVLTTLHDFGLKDQVGGICSIR